MCESQTVISVLMLSGSLRRCSQMVMPIQSECHAAHLCFIEPYQLRKCQNGHHTAIKGHLNSMQEEGMSGGGDIGIEAGERV